jgi:hypothetical protein
LSNVEKLEGVESFKAIWILKHNDKGGMAALESPRLSLLILLIAKDRK